MGLEIGWEKIDRQAKNNSEPQMNGLQDFSNLELLKDDNIEIKNIACIGELNQAILDDEQINFPTNTSNYKFCLWSKKVSNNDCKFDSEQKLTINLSEPATSSGLTLLFWEPSNDFCSNVTIKWYDGAGVLLSSKNFTINSYKYFCSNFVENYSKLEIIFNETANPR